MNVQDLEIERQRRLMAYLETELVVERSLANSTRTREANLALEFRRSCENTVDATCGLMGEPQEMLIIRYLTPPAALSQAFLLELLTLQGCISGSSAETCVLQITLVSFPVEYQLMMELWAGVYVTCGAEAVGKVLEDVQLPQLQRVLDSELMMGQLEAPLLMRLLKAFLQVCCTCECGTFGCVPGT